jgi:hypothetical protein
MTFTDSGLIESDCSYRGEEELERRSFEWEFDIEGAPTACTETLTNSKQESATHYSLGTDEYGNVTEVYVEWFQVGESRQDEGGWLVYSADYEYVENPCLDARAFGNLIYGPYVSNLSDLLR